MNPSGNEHQLLRRLLVLLALILPATAGAQAPPQFKLTREIRIDATTEDLSPVTWLAVSRAGTIAVGQQQDHLIRYFDANGKPLGTFGRAGEGPGEFRQLTRFGGGWIGDTLWVDDYALRRFTLVTPDRKVLRTVPAQMEIKGLGDSAGGMQVIGAVGFHPDGTQLIYAILPSAVEKRPHWARDPEHLGAQMVLMDVTPTGEFERAATFEPHDDCGMVARAGYQLCGHPKLGIDPNGRRFAWATMAYAGPDSGTYRITMVGRDGKTVYSRSYPFIAQPIPKRIRDSLAERGKALDRPISPSMAPRFGLPTIYPAMETVIVGIDGTVWVRLRATPAGNPWVMLSPKGDAFGTLIAPANVDLEVLGHGLVWGTEKNADDLESIVRFRVTRQ